MTSKRAVLYARVSSAKQVEEGHSLGDQQERLERDARARGFVVVSMVIDQAESGASMDRPGMREVMAIVDAGGVDVVVATKADRISRSLHDLVLLWRRLEGCGVELLTIDEQIDTSTPMGKAMAQMRGVFAELEREMIRSRTREGLAAAKAKGVWIGRPPIGYTSERGRLIPVPGPDLDLVEWATMKRDCGLSLRQVACLLNDMGTPAPRGGRWFPASVQRLLRGPTLAEQYSVRCSGRSDPQDAPTKSPS